MSEEVDVSFKKYVPLKPLTVVVGNGDIADALANFLRNSATPKPHVIIVQSAKDYEQLQGPFSSGGKLLGTHRSGILRADWLEKHQSRVPAVAIVIVSRDEACGDPSSWAALAARLDAVRSAAKRRAVPVVVALMTSATRGALPDDRSAMVARHAGTERGCIVTCDVDDGPAAFQFLAPVVSTQASAFYAATAQRRMAAYAQNNLPSVDLNLRAAFKVAVLAEQRGDWEAAARLYREAYSYFPQVAVAGAAPLQRFLEVRAVAEVVNYRLLRLLLLVLKTAEGAAAQLDDHLRLLGNVPLSPVPRAIACDHQGWLALQLSAAAELVAASGIPLSGLPSQLHPAQLYLAAAKASLAMRRDRDAIVGECTPREGIALRLGTYLGQYELPSSTGEGLTDAEVAMFVESQVAMGEAGQRPIDLLQAARAAVLSAASESSGRPSSMQCHVDAALGDELLTCGRVDEAEAILSDAAEVYRSCGWWGPLWPVLISLRECAARQKKTAAHIEVSLEAAAIAADSDAAQRRALAEAAVGELQGHDAPAMHFTCSTTRAPWASVVEVAAGFASRKDAPPRLAMALRNKLPIPLPLGSCSASFDDSQGTFHGHFEGGTLDPGRWAVNYVEPKASASGLLTATAVELAVGASSTVTFALPGAMHNGMRAALPTAADELIRWGQRAIELPPHHAAPSVHVGLPDVVLVGESVPVMVNIETGADAICMCTLEVEGGAVNRLQRVGSSTEEISIAVTQSPDGAQGAASVEPTSVFNLAANSRHSTGMYLSAQHIGSITVHVLLKYKALSKESGVEEAGRVMASSTAKVALPFQLDIAVAGPPGVVYALHTAHESGAAEITAQTKGLTVSLPGMEGAFSCSILAPWLPGHVMVPASHPFTLSCNVRCLAGTPLKVTVGHEGGGVAMSPLLPELAGVELGSPGETCAFPFAVGPVAPSEIGSLGNLTISWMRPSSEGNHTISGKLSMALPSATAVAPRLSASVSHPCEGRMGESMCLELQVHSNLERTEEVKVVVGEPNGFLVGGVKEGMAAVAAGASTTLTFTAVPYHAGFLKLPDIMIFHPSGGEPLLATKDCHVFVLPVNYSRS